MITNWLYNLTKTESKPNLYTESWPKMLEQINFAKEN